MDYIQYGLLAFPLRHQRRHLLAVSSMFNIHRPSSVSCPNTHMQFVNIYQCKESICRHFLSLQPTASFIRYSSHRGSSSILGFLVASQI